MTESLAQQLANKRYRGWKPATDEWLHALAVIGGEKPAAYVSVFGDELDRVQELERLAREHGCGTLIHCEPQLVFHGEQPSLAFCKGMLVYRDEAVREQYVQLIRDSYLGRVSDDDYNRRSGKIFGYGDADIEEYVRSRLPAEKTAPKNSDALAYLKTKALPAVYDELAKDPVLGGILPPRPVTQITKYE